MAAIGFIGLGAMGLPMARRLCEAGHALKVAVHKNSAPVEEIAELGGVVVDATEVMADVDVVVSIVPGDAELFSVYLSASAAAMAPGTLVLEMTTASPAAMRAVAEHLQTRGIRVLDAPVSGGVRGACEGVLTIMCGGDTETYEAALPILRVLGAKTPLVGDVGAGKSLKAVNQLLVSVNTVVVAEALCLARKTGVNLDAMRDVIAASSGASAAFASKFDLMVKEDFTPRFTTALMRKDIGIALAEGKEKEVALPMTTLANHLYGLLGKEAKAFDYSIIAKLYCQE